MPSPWPRTRVADGLVQGFPAGAVQAAHWEGRQPSEERLSPGAGGGRRRAVTAETLPRPVSSLLSRTKSLLCRGDSKTVPLGTGRILQQLGEGSGSSQHQYSPTHLPNPPKKITKGLLVMRKGSRTSRRTLRNPTGWGALLLRETQEHKPGQQGT